MSSFNAGSIFGALKLDTDPYAQGMLKATSIARVFPETVTTFLTNPLLGVADVLKNVAGSFVDFFGEAAEHADAMGDLARSVGVSVDQLTALGEVASLAGSSTQGVADAYRFLGKSVSEALGSASSDAARTFRSMGVEFLTAQGTARPLSEVMLQLADAFAKLPEGGARTSAAMNLLGRSGTELIPTLIQGRKALADQMAQMQAYGATVTTATNETADRWHDAMDEMGIAWRGLKQSFSDTVRPILLPRLEELLDWTRKHQPEIRAAINSMGLAVVEAYDRTAPTFTAIIAHAREIAGVAAGVAAYMAGPAVLGAVLKIGPALLTIVAPLSAVRLAVLAVKTAMDPSTLPLKALSAGLGLLTAYIIEQPGALKALHAGWQYMAATAGYVGDVIRKVLVPAVGNELATAFTHLQPFLPTTSSLLGLVGVAVDGLRTTFESFVGFVAQGVVPAIGKGLAAAFDWIGPKLHFVGDVFKAELAILQSVAAWIMTTGVDAVGNVFAAAWDTLGTVAGAVAQPFEFVYGLLQEVVGWIVGNAVPSIASSATAVWSSVSPYIASLGRLVAGIYQSVLAPVAGWIIGTAFPGIVAEAVTAWNTLEPIFAGLGRVLLGVWDLGAGLASWVVAAVTVACRVAAVAVDGVTFVIRKLADTIGWMWTHVAQPVIGWVWSAAKPALETIGSLIGYLIEKVGQLLSWLGSVIDLSGQATKAVNAVPVAPGGPPAALAAPLGAGGGDFGSTPPSAAGRPSTASAPSFDESAFFAQGPMAKAAGAVGDLAAAARQQLHNGVAGVGGLLPSVPTLPRLAIPEIKLPSIGDIGSLGKGSGVEPLADRLADLRRGTAAVADGHAAAKNNESVDVRQRNREFEATKSDYNRQIQEAIHNHSGLAEVERLRAAKGNALRNFQPSQSSDSAAGGTGSQPAINVHVPAVNEDKLSTLVAGKVLEGQNRQLDQATAAGRAASHRQNVAEGL